MGVGNICEGPIERGMKVKESVVWHAVVKKARVWSSRCPGLIIN